MCLAPVSQNGFSQFKLHTMLQCLAEGTYVYGNNKQAGFTTKSTRATCHQQNVFECQFSVKILPEMITVYIVSSHGVIVGFHGINGLSSNVVCEHQVAANMMVISFVSSQMPSAASICSLQV